MTVVKVYMDEGGTDSGAKVLTVAGYAARHPQWKAFTREWKRTLRPSGIKCYHATDAQALQGDFKGWTGPEVAKLASQLLPIIPRYAAGLAIAIVMRDFNDAMAEKPHLRELFASPYGACFQWLIQSLCELAHSRSTSTRFAFVHETNDMKREAQEAFDWVKAETVYGGRLVSLAFADKTEFTPLQAADILAFEVQRRLANQENPERLSFQALNPDGHNLWVRFYDKRNMATLIETLERAAFLKSQLAARLS